MSDDVEKQRLIKVSGRFSADSYSDPSDLTTDNTTSLKKNGSRKTLLYASIALPWCLLVVLGSYSWSTIQYHKTRYYVRPDLVYSPVQDLIKYETRVFTTGLPKDQDPDVSPYAQEPSDEVDQLWTSLYPNLFQLITQEQAAKLANKTVLFPHDDQHRYVIELDVFHQLHCLNMVRKATRPDYYAARAQPGSAEAGLISPPHIAHCIDAIRQSLMCSADVTPYTWTWDPVAGSHRNQVKNLHTCRNFDVLRDWVRDHTKLAPFDFDYREPNDPLDPTTWTEGYLGPSRRR